MGIFKKQKPSAELPGRRRPAVPDQNSQRAQAFSYYAQRKTPDANTGRGQPIETITEHGGSRPKHMNRLVALFGCLAAIVAAFYVLSLSTDPKVVPAAGNGGNGNFFLHSAADYQETAAGVLGSSLFNRNKLTADTASVSRELTKKYPEIHTATVTIPLIGSQPVVHIKPYQPALTLSTLDNQAYLIDETGRALAPTNQISNIGELSVPTVEDKSGLSIQRGSQALPAGTVQFITQVVRILDSAKVAYQTITLPAGTSEVDVYISGTPYFVKFNLQGDPRLQTGTYLATKQRLQGDKISPAQYIDVRVPERAYYK